jgi:hypothetical protein
MIGIEDYKIFIINYAKTAFPDKEIDSLTNSELITAFSMAADDLFKRFKKEMNQGTKMQRNF